MLRRVWETGLAFSAIRMVMEGTRLGKRMGAGQRALLPPRGEMDRGWGLWQLSPPFCCNIPFHHRTDQVLMPAGELGTPAVVASGNPLPLATSSSALMLTSFKAEFGIVAE